MRRAERDTNLSAWLGYFAARPSLVPFVATTGYVATLSLAADPSRGFRTVCLASIALAGAFVAARPSLPGNGLRKDGKRQVGILAYGLWSASLVLAASASPVTTLWLDFSAGAAALIGSVVAAAALRSLEATQGVAVSLPRSPGAIRVVLGGLFVLFAAALFSSALALRDPSSTIWDGRPHDAHAVAAGGALVILAAAALMTVRDTRLVVGVGDRATIALGSIVAASVVSLGALAVFGGTADRALRLAVGASSLLVSIACTAGDPERLSRLARRGIALLLFGGPVILLGALAAEGGGRSVVALLVTGVVTLGIGSMLPYLEEPLRPAEGRLLDAMARANVALVRADPETSMRDALSALRMLANTMPHSPELWSLSPARVTTIDGAGYPRSRDAALPPLIVEIAKEEPEATVPGDLLEALLVRRPDLRPLARWMDERGALSLTLVSREGELEGALVVPRGPRREPMTLEEVRAVKRLADAFSGVSAAEAALRRSMSREQEASARADRAEERFLSHERAMSVSGERAALATARIAEVAAAGPYSPAARLAFASIERCLATTAPLVVLTSPGSDVIPYLARAHLETRRRGGPFVVVSGASPETHDAGRWGDPSRSPLALADGGLLVLEDVHRLPPGVQRLVADALSQRRAPWERPEPIDIALAVTGAGTLDSLVATLDDALSMRLDAALAGAVTWPPLRDRSEDLRSLVLAGLAREGVRQRGTAIGIDDAAYARLAEYSFPGEEAELCSMLQRLTSIAEESVVRVADIDRLGLPAREEFPAGLVPRLSERISP